MNEADTRAELIDPQLKEAGWGEIEGSRIQREYNINLGEIRAGGIRAGVLKADYVLSYKNRKLAVIEAKSNEVNVNEGVGQAKEYAKKLLLDFTYAANGEEIYEINTKTGEEKLVEKFPSPEELWNRTFKQRNEWNDNFDSIHFNDVNGTRQARYYQEIAVNKVMQAIADKRERILLTLATGTGKTFISFQIAWKLFKSRWNLQRDGKRSPRILFLADRNILANQAYLDFSGFDESALIRIRPSEINRRGEVPTNASVFFTIFQTFMSGPNNEPYFGQYPPDFFDFIIVDECHRGGANDESSWREILEYFNPAVQIGLTATPKRRDNVDTYDYFGDPVYNYSLKEGIRDGFLTPFKVLKIESTIDEYEYEPEDEVVEGEIEEGKIYTESDFNRNIVIEERERKRVQDMLASINKDEKTLVFCGNQAHAAMIRDLINQEYQHSSVDYCVRVTANDGNIGDTHLRNFQDNDKNIPTILTTSQKLTTGVDARNIRNIVLMRPVNNMIEFKQIIGRGTRLYEGKHFFTVIDFVNAYQLFNDPEWDGEPLEPVPTIPRPPGTPSPDDPVPPEPPFDGPEDPEPRQKVKIKLADGKEREIYSESSTMFIVDGEVVGSKEFLEKIYNTLRLPDLLKSEEELRTLWANPITRRELIERLELEGCKKEELKQIQTLIDAENSDLFDVLEYISYARPLITRQERVLNAQSNIFSMLNENQKEFIEFVLQNYIKSGVDELDDTKLGDIISLKYKSTYDAEKILGDIDSIRNIFIDFQKHLYIPSAV